MCSADQKLCVLIFIFSCKSEYLHELPFQLKTILVMRHGIKSLVCQFRANKFIILALQLTIFREQYNLVCYCTKATYTQWLRRVGIFRGGPPTRSIYLSSIENDQLRIYIFNTAHPCCCWIYPAGCMLSAQIVCIIIMLKLKPCPRLAGKFRRPNRVVW